MIGVFKGKDGSHGFKKGKAYSLETGVEESYIWVQDTNPRTKTTPCPYDSIEAILRNWNLLPPREEK